MNDRAQIDAGVGEILTEIHEYPQLRPPLQYEIERLFGVQLTFEMDQYNLNVYGGDGSSADRLLVNQHGRGLQYYIALFFYLYHPDIRVLLVDEPENSLHPQLQRALIDRVRYLARNERKQVFLATHSPLLALPETADDLEGLFLLQRYRREPRIFPLSVLVPTEPNERRAFDSFLPNLDPAIAELLFATGSLIVEGQTERQFMQYIANRTERNPHQLGVTIVESNGLGIMPGLIRMARLILDHWRAMCDGDLLTSRDRPRFDDYRNKFSATLEEPIPLVPPRDDLAFQAAQDSIRRRGLFVLSKKGLEEYFVSPEAEEYLRANSKVDPKDKGWLLGREIEFLKDKLPNFINATYADLLQPLDSLLSEVRDALSRPRTMVELMRDILYDDANIIHRNAYRDRLSEEDLRRLLDRSQHFNAYDLVYRAFNDYDLVWRDSSSGRFRIRCEGVRFNVEHEARPDHGYEVLLYGTVDKE
jgi:hypothetical protein